MYNNPHVVYPSFNNSQSGVENVSRYSGNIQTSHLKYGMSTRWFRDAATFTRVHTRAITHRLWYRTHVCPRAVRAGARIREYHSTDISLNLNDFRIMEQPLINNNYSRSWHRPGRRPTVERNEASMSAETWSSRVKSNHVRFPHKRQEAHRVLSRKWSPALPSRKLSKAGGLSGSRNLEAVSGLGRQAVPSDFVDHFLVQPLLFCVEMIHFDSIRGRHLPDIFVKHFPNRVSSTLLPQQPANILLHLPIPQHSTTGFLTDRKLRFYRPPTRRQSDYLLYESHKNVSLPVLRALPPPRFSRQDAF